MARGWVADAAGVPTLIVHQSPSICRTLYSQPTDDHLSLVRQAGNEVCGRLATRQTDPLACPERQILPPALPGSGIAERPRQRILQGEGENSFGGVGAVDFCHETVDDPPCRATREGARQARLVLTRGEDCLLV